MTKIERPSGRFFVESVLECLDDAVTAVVVMLMMAAWGRWVACSVGRSYE